MENRKRIYLCLAHMSGNEMKYIKDAFDTNWVVPLGPNVNGFEEDLENFVGQNKEVVALSAGTAAVHLALIDCDVKAGDEVKAGDVIAAVGSTGNSTGPHLHLEIRINGQHVNPQKYIYNN